jgi:alkanesulfonate monooxygenase SsuD/methylene tetrahydromethanopterin reductase-like flavin-dependent oxidoreductase (luciferase family)
MVEWFLFLPQVRLTVPGIVERAQVAEASGFDGVAFIDHLLAPGAEDKPIWEAMTVAAWVAAKTTSLRIGHLVLCDAFRHPAVLAKQAVTLHEATEGRFELGLGSGSVPSEMRRFGITRDDAAKRHARLARDLELLSHYWGYADNERMRQTPQPSAPIPLVIGGTGARAMELVRRYATWWNLPAPRIGLLPELLPLAGSARISVQQMVGFVGRDHDAAQVRETSTRRFGHLGEGLVCGDAGELLGHFSELADQGVERFYVWFADFAPSRTIAEFATTVIAEFDHD